MHSVHVYGLCRYVCCVMCRVLCQTVLCCAMACCGVLCPGGKGKAVSGSVIRATIPYVKADIPILVLFRALGTVVSFPPTFLLFLAFPFPPFLVCVCVWGGVGGAMAGRLGEGSCRVGWLCAGYVVHHTC